MFNFIRNRKELTIKKEISGNILYLIKVAHDLTPDQWEDIAEANVVSCNYKTQSIANLKKHYKRVRFIVKGV